MLIMVKQRQALIPATGFDWDGYARIKDGALVEATLKQRRSTPHNRFYRAVVAKAAEQWPVEGRMAPEVLHFLNKQAYGHGAFCQGYDGETIWVPDSVAFDRMDETEFRKFTAVVIPLMAGRLGITTHDLLANAGTTT
ncbi:MAG: hypothetical protein AAF556_09585 [Pseudomonadota bacterium]